MFFSQLTLSRPKGPSSRKRPHRYSAPPPTTSAATSESGQDATKRHSHNVLETWLSSIETGQLPQDAMQQPASSSMESTQVSRDSRRGSKESGSVEGSPVMKNSRRRKDSSDGSHNFKNSRRNSKDNSSIDGSNKPSRSRKSSKESSSVEETQGSRRFSKGNDSLESSQVLRRSRRGSKDSSMQKDSSKKLSTSSLQDHAAIPGSAPLTGPPRPHADTTPIPHPHGSSADSTPSGSPSIHRNAPAQEVRRLPQIKGNIKLPQLDLTSLAPEQKQVVSGVKKGWPEGAGAVGGAKEEEEVGSSESIKDLSHKIHG